MLPLVLHGWGVVCGLWAVPAKDPARPWTVQVCPGYAIGPYADEIEVRAPALVDVRDYLWRRPHDAAGNPARRAYVGIRYVEQHVRPIPTQPPGCGCEETVYEPSRIRDGFQVDVLWVLPTDEAEGFDICEQGLAPCPVCPDSPYVILACITLPASEGDPITHDRIDNFVRRQLFSTAMLQEPLIACCCKERQLPAPAADLRITKEFSEVGLGTGVVRSYTITVVNQGPSFAPNITVEDDFSFLPDGVRASDFQTSQGQWTQIWPDRPFRANLGQLEPSQTATLNFSVFFPGGVTSENTATVRSDAPDPDINNNQVTI